jgi:hypothetical protein
MRERGYLGGREARYSLAAVPAERVFMGNEFRLSLMKARLSGNLRVT